MIEKNITSIVVIDLYKLTISLKTICLSLYRTGKKFKQYNDIPEKCVKNVRK